MSLADWRCREPGCWHRRTKGLIYCVCCVHGRCYKFSEEEKEQIRKELEVTDDGTRPA